MAETKRRALGEDAIYFDHRAACRDALKHRQCPGHWLGVVSLGCDADGKRIRKKVYGRTKTDVKDKLKRLHEDLDQGVRTSASYTVATAVADWLDQGLDGRSAKTISTNREVLAPLLPPIGKIPLRELTAARPGRSQRIVAHRYAHSNRLVTDYSSQSRHRLPRRMHHFADVVLGGALGSRSCRRAR
jgi:hypothetical protein